MFNPTPRRGGHPLSAPPTPTWGEDSWGGVAYGGGTGSTGVGSASRAGPSPHGPRGLRGGSLGGGREGGGGGGIVREARGHPFGPGGALQEPCYIFELMHEEAVSHPGEGGGVKDVWEKAQPCS